MAGLICRSVLPLETLLGSSWGLTVPSWPHLEPSQGHLAVSWPFLRTRSGPKAAQSSARRGPETTQSGVLVAIYSVFGMSPVLLLSGSWHPLGALGANLASPGATLVPKMRPKMEHKGPLGSTTLGKGPTSCWPKPLSTHLGISLGLLSTTCDIWESLWGHLETISSCLGAVIRGGGRASLGNLEASPLRLGPKFYHF